VTQRAAAESLTTTSVLTTAACNRQTNTQKPGSSVLTGGSNCAFKSQHEEVPTGSRDATSTSEMKS